ncbi:terminase, partial [Shigella boydii]
LMPFYFRKECPLNSGYLNRMDLAMAAPGTKRTVITVLTTTF